MSLFETEGALYVWCLQVKRGFYISGVRGNTSPAGHVISRLMQLLRPVHVL